MGRMAELMEHPGHYLSEASHMVARRPKSVGGIVLLAGFVLVLAWMWPEIQRYIKIKRM